MRFDDQFTDLDVLDDEFVSFTNSRETGREGEAAQRTPRRGGGVRANRSGPTGFDRAMTIREAAQVLGVSYATARRLLLENKISYQRVSPRRTVVRESALLAYLRATTAEATRAGEFPALGETPPDRCHQGCERRRPD
ncbi:MAG: helix-turn-helix domain-containing protein [Acidimicrobiales bacterium]